MNDSKKFHEALDLARSGNYGEALAIYTDIIEHNENLRAEVLGHRAWLYRTMHCYEEALRDYDRLMEIEHGELEIMARRAETLLFLGRIKEAARAAVEVLSRDPMEAISIQVVIDCQKAEGVEKANKKLQFPFGNYTESPLNPVIKELEIDQGSFPVSVFPGLGRFLYTFIRCCRPLNVVEIGTNIGYSGLCIAQGLADNGMGHLFSFDLFENTPDQLAKVRAHFEEANLTPWASFYKGDSSSTIQKTLDPKLRIDLAFIDGDHTLKGCLKDWYIVDMHLKAGGIVLLHDTEPAHCHWLGPRYLVEELYKRGQNAYHAINLPTADGCGIGIIQKTNDDTIRHWMPTIKDLLIQRLYHQIRRHGADCS